MYPTESDDWRFPPDTVIVSLFTDREHATWYVWPLTNPVPPGTRVATS